MNANYSLMIRRYNTYLMFETLEELRSELSNYFSVKEINKGIVEQLTDFSQTNKNSYQDIEIERIVR